MDFMQIFYINLARSTERRANMERQFTALGLLAERIEAVTPADIPPEMIRRYCEPKPLSLQWVQPTELACTLSHRKAWASIIERGLEWGVVLEDDAVLSTAFAQALAPHSGVDLIRLETRHVPVTIEAGSGLKRLFGFHPGTAAYIVSRRGAQILLAGSNLRYPADHFMFDPRGPMFHRLEMRQLVPAVVTITPDTPSEIGDRTSNVAERTKRRKLPHAVAQRLLLRVREEARERSAKLVGAVTERVPFVP
jgi:glycosyl transferase family 25